MNECPFTFFFFFFTFFIAIEHGVRNFVTIFPTASLREMAEKAPTSVEAMKKVENLPEAKIKKYNAERFLEVTVKYNALYECEL